MEINTDATLPENTLLSSIKVTLAESKAAGLLRSASLFGCKLINLGWGCNRINLREVRLLADTAILLAAELPPIQ
jgi:hypothetical protein